MLNPLLAIVGVVWFATLGKPTSAGHLDELRSGRGQLFVCAIGKMPTEKKYDVTSGCDGALRDYDWHGVLNCSFIPRLPKCEKPST